MPAGKELGHHPRQVQHGGLGGGIAVGLDFRDALAIDRADVDHLGEIVRGGGRFQQLDEALRQEEDGFDVEVHHLVPAGLGKIIERRAPACAGVVEQHIDAALAGRHFGREALDLFHLGKIGGNRDAAAKLREFGGEPVTHRGVAGGDDDAGAVLHHGAGDHLADATAAAGHHHNLVTDRKQLFDLHRQSPENRFVKWFRSPRRRRGRARCASLRRAAACGRQG